MAVEGSDLVVICPGYVKHAMVLSGRFRRARFLTKGEVTGALAFAYDDRDVLLYAARENISYDEARTLFAMFPLLLEKPASEGFGPAVALFAKRRQALAGGFLKTGDPLLKAELMARHIVLAGYDREEKDLVSLLEQSGFAAGGGRGSYSLVTLADLGLATGKPAAYCVSHYSEAWIECLFGMERLAGFLADHAVAQSVDPALVAIVCPASYNCLVLETASLLGISVEIAQATARDFPLIREFLAEYRARGTWDSLAASSHRNGFFDTLVARAYSAMAITRTVSDVAGRERCADYLAAALATPVYVPGIRKGVRVYNSLAAAQPAAALFAFGFSDALFPSAKDNGLIPDRLKPSYTMASDAVSRNVAMENHIHDFLSLCGNVSLSRSDADSLKPYGPCYFATGEKGKWLTERDATADRIVSRGLAQGRGRKDLGVYISVFRDRHDSIGLRNDMAATMAFASPASAACYMSYDNDFDDDKATQAYFRNYFAKDIKLSHTSLDTYQDNPFAYYCRYVLGISSPSDFSSLRGQLLHSYAEERDSFSFEQKADTLLEGFSEDSGVSLAEARYFLKRAAYNFRELVLPGLSKAEKDCDLVPLRPADGSDEFAATVSLGNGLFLEVRYDAVYWHGKNECVIVDYKSSDPKYYVNAIKSLTGRMLQLPLYIFSFPYAKTVVPEFGKLSDPFGAYITLLLSKSGMIQQKEFFTGFQLIDKSLNSADDKSKAVKRIDASPKADSDKRRRLDVLDEAEDRLTAHLDTAGFDLAGFPGHTPATAGKSIGERMVTIAGIALLKCLYYLRHGRLSTAGGIAWFPVYQVQYIGSSGDEGPRDDYQDISFARKYQRHYISFAEANLNTSSTWNDFDGKRLVAEDEDEDDDDDSDDSDDSDTSGEDD